MSEPIPVQKYGLKSYVSPEMAHDERTEEIMRTTLVHQAEKAGWTVLPDTFSYQLHERNFASPAEWEDPIPEDYLLATASVRVYRAAEVAE